MRASSRSSAFKDENTGFLFARECLCRHADTRLRAVKLFLLARSQASKRRRLVRIIHPSRKKRDTGKYLRVGKNGKMPELR
jgi:hypothetical protein